MTYSFSRWVNNKTKEDLQQAGNIRSFLKNLQEYAIEFKIEGKNILTLQRVETLGLDKGKNTFHDEAFLERLFLRAHEDDLYNHFSFNGNSSVDLVRATEQGHITDLIELKKGSNHLYHALYEIIFYYFLLCRAKNEINTNKKPTLSDTLHLTVLLPQALYEQPDRYNKDKKAFVATLQKELDNLVEPTDPKPTLYVVPIPNDHPFLTRCETNREELIQAYKGENQTLYNELIHATQKIKLP